MFMKRNCLGVCSAILCLLVSIPVLAQVSVTGGSRDVQAPRNVNIAAVDEKLKTAAEMMHAQPPNYDQAIATLTETTQMAPDQDGVWYRLGVAYLEWANAQTDPAEKTKCNAEAYHDLEKAIEVHGQRKTQERQENFKPVCNVEGVCKHDVPVNVGDISDNHKLAVYYSNLGDAAARLGKNEEASKDFQQAAQFDPADAGTYYFDLGIILRNTAKTVDERKLAVEAFDKAIAADPNKAADYYLKGEVLFAMVTTDSEGKILPPPGTIEALQKYLALQPNGPYAQQAKSFLAALNTTNSSDNGSSKKK
jgi:tetratricopeptide (TPR) repeat protein